MNIKKDGKRRKMNIKKDGFERSAVLALSVQAPRGRPAFPVNAEDDPIVGKVRDVNTSNPCLPEDHWNFMSPPLLLLKKNTPKHK